MQNLKEQIKETLKWKKHPTYCAAKLGILESEYVKLKKEVLLERRLSKKKKKHLQKISQDVNVTEAIDLDKGTGKISGTFNHEPKSAEEIISLLKIDTSIWKLSQYWNKQMGDHWRVSALVSRVKETSSSDFEKLLESWTPKTYKIPKTNSGILQNKEKVCGVISLQDIHFGKEGNETIDKDFEDTIINLLERATPAHSIDTMYFVVGGDLINMDTFHGTTTSGTPLDNCMSSTEAYMKAFDAMHWAINYIKAFCNKLVVVYVPGNHDRLSSFHLAHALSKSITSDEITWDVK